MMIIVLERGYYVKRSIEFSIVILDLEIIGLSKLLKLEEK